MDTRSGLLAENAIVLIGGLCVRATGNYHEIDYTCGAEARTTRATEAAVQEYLCEEETGT